MNQCRFIFDGERIKETDTPASLSMEDLDVIEIFVEQTGGYWALFIHDYISEITNLNNFSPIF